MSKGGFREGAGRKKGTANTLTRAVAEKALESGLSPLEVLLQCMRKAVQDGDMQAAANYAGRAAPYCHPRLSGISLDLSGISTDELTKFAGVNHD